MAGFFNAMMCTCGEFTNDCINLSCTFATYIAEIAGAIRLAHAYHLENSGSQLGKPCDH